MIEIFGPIPLSLLILLGLAALMLAPFLLFSLPRRLSGKHMLGFMLALFGLIIAVNVGMAWFSIGSFPGLETPNSYVASQQFDRQRAAQEALGWVVTPQYDGREMVLEIRDGAGAPAQVAALSAVIGRPTHQREDVTPEFIYRDGAWRAPLALAPGRWNIHLTARALDGTEFRQRLDHYSGNVVKGD